MSASESLWKSDCFFQGLFSLLSSSTHDTCLDVTPGPENPHPRAPSFIHLSFLLLVELVRCMGDGYGICFGCYWVNVVPQCSPNCWRVSFG